jgi:hypothetical protein
VKKNPRILWVEVDISTSNKGVWEGSWDVLQAKLLSEDSQVTQEEAALAFLLLSAIG